MMTLDLIPKSFIELKKKCEIYVQAKQPRISFQNYVQKETCLLELIHCDICDRNGVITHGGNKHFITFTDDFSKYCYVYLIIHKSELFDKFKVYKAEVENQLERKIKILHSNSGGEFSSNEMKPNLKYLKVWECFANVKLRIDGSVDKFKARLVII
uniref:Retrovirus-related Pol polyprotein from transposon TNT 1-94 n=1 Tax=Cajanus cajan TaxID=3821 RepID=A0A151SP16_CAJCA|nr:Retrovirus-related Pol polyprotein from transposon TNT 1-94 [Cajanus cajan]